MPAEPVGIEPRLSRFDASMVVVSLVIGIGIFRTPALVAGATGSTAAFLAAWIIGGVVSLVGALVFAEIGSRRPRAGGYYEVVAHCWNPMTAFLLNWAQVLMQGAGAAGVALIGAEYLLRLVGRRDPHGAAPALIAGATVLGLIAINAVGIRAGARAQNALSLAKILLIAGLATAGLAWVAPAAPDAPALREATSTPTGVLSALVAVLYAYGGSQNTINIAGDVRDARRNLPRAVLLGMAVVTALYVTINVAYVRALGVTGIAASPLVAADLSRVVFGQAGEAFVSLVIFLSAAGFVNATILQVPRSYLAMAQDGLLPQVLGRVNPRTQSQGIGLVFLAATVLVPLAFLGSFEQLLAYVMFTDALSLVVVAACLFVLRRRGEGESEAGTWRMPGYPWLPLGFVAVLLGVAVDVLARQTGVALGGSAVVLAGIPLYAAIRARSRRSAGSRQGA